MELSEELYNEALKLHFNNAKFDDAVIAYEKIIRLYPNSKEARLSKKQIASINNLSENEIKTISSMSKIKINKPKAMTASVLINLIEKIIMVLIGITLIVQIILIAIRAN